METVYLDYAGQGVKFYYIYKSVQHPEVNGFVHAFTLDERLRHIAELKRRSGSSIPWLCDNMDNQLQLALGGPPNGEFIVDPQGKIIRQRFWSDPHKLRQDLSELVGPVDKPTQVADIDVRFRVETRTIASGIVPRLDLPGKFQPILTLPGDAESQPYFAKLRAEVSQGALAKRGGKLYLGLFLDPLYQVHWNNQAGRVRIQLESEGAVLSQETLESPLVGKPADIDPREFLIDFELQSRPAHLQARVSYVACDDANTFCIPIEQTYTIRFQRDAEGGSRPNAFLNEMFADVESLDRNGDGTITADEIPAGQRTLFLGHLDKDDNGLIDSTEILEFRQMFGP